MYKRIQTARRQLMSHPSLKIVRVNYGDLVSGSHPSHPYSAKPSERLGPEISLLRHELREISLLYLLLAMGRHTHLECCIDWHDQLWTPSTDSDTRHSGPAVNSRGRIF